MKFVLQTVANSKLRLGKLSNFPRIPELYLETPLLLLYAKGGSIPHITYEVLQLLSEGQHLVQVSLPSTVQTYEGVKDFKKGIAQFVGLKEYLMYCTVQDPAVQTPRGYNTKSSVAVWTNSGKMMVDSERYMDIMEAFQPDIYQALCDGDTNRESTQKRSFKVVENTANMFSRCLEIHKKSEVLKSSALFGVVEGGFNLTARTKCASFMAEQPVDGFVIDGFHNNGQEAENIKFEEVEPILVETLKLLPEDKLKVMHGCWRPQNILRLVEMGIDVFDSSLAYLVTERLSALVFKYEDVSWHEVQDRNSEEIHFEMPLEDKQFAEDFNPILEGCSCLSCRKHTRAYIHHLVKSKELLASTLLMLHNLHHYMEFFKAIRRAAKNGRRIQIVN